MNPGLGPEHERLRALWRARWPAHETALVAFVVARDGAGLDADTLRQWLARTLPAPMLPARIVAVAELPRTPGGKLDRHALQLPLEHAAPRRDAVAPRTAVEARLAALFAQVLGAAPQGVHEDFFAHLGGHSLLATQLASLIRREWPVTFELRAVFEHPTVAGLAACIESGLEGARQHGEVAAQRAIPRRAGSGDGTAG